MGRHREVAHVADALRARGLVTLVGPGGVGKTRLALRTARVVRPSYAYGAWLVDLTAVSDPTRVATAVAAVLGAPERHGWDTLDSLRAALRGRQVLVILDNCEHVLQSCAELVGALLKSCEDLTFLATSREPMGVPGEVVYRVSPLSIADATDDFERLLASEAVQLLIERVHATSPGLQVTPRVASLAARVCRLVDGLPLAIELAAARAHTMSLAEISDRLDAPLRVLTTGPRSAALRQQTLRSTIDWSYELLTDAECILLRRLAVFSGGCTLEGARAVCVDAQLGSDLILDLLDRLVSQSLLTADTRHDHARFSLLDTVRQYCLERLQQAGETTTVRQRHAEWCLALVATQPSGILDIEWVARLTPDLENLRTAWRWMVDTSQHELATRMAVRMSMIWNLSGLFAEGRAALTEVVAFATEGIATSEVQLAGIWAAILAANQGDYPDAEDLARHALRIAAAARDDFAVSFAENTLGWVAFLKGDLLAARKGYEHTYAVAAALDHPLHLLSRHQLVMLYTETGDLGRAADILHDLTAESPNSRSRLWIGRVLVSRAQLAERAGDYPAADQLLEQAVSATRDVDDQPGLLEALTLRGAIAVDHGDRTIATGSLTEAVEIAAVHGSKLRLIHLLEAVANLVREADPTACVRLAMAAEHLRSTLGAAPKPTEQARLGRYLDVARRHVDETAYAHLRHQATATTLEGVLAEVRQALSAVGAAGPGGSATERAEALSEREREVAMLVARGFSNRQIADQLVIGLKTVETHVHNVLNKLGLSNRVQIATWAQRHGVDLTRESLDAC